MDKLHFLVCANLACELQSVLDQYNFTDVDLSILECDCNRPIIGQQDIQKTIDSLGAVEYSDICIIGSVCLGDDFLESYRGIKLHKLDNCFELFLNKSILKSYLSRGYYIVSSGWLRSCWSTFDTWGFDSVTIKQFFAESASKILYLDTSVFQDSRSFLKEVSDHLGLEYEILEVGLDHMGNFIHSIILQWRYEIEKQYQNSNLAKLTRQAADYSLVFDQLSYLTALKSESEIVNSLKTLFDLLFSAREFVYLPIIDGVAGQAFHYPSHADHEIPPDALTWIRSNQTEDDMLINISIMTEEIGVILLKGVSFPEYISHYKQLGVFLSNIAALGISNARKYSHVQEQEKQLAALINQKDKLFSVLAHDLRGPLGSFIGLTEIMHDSTLATVNEEFRELSGVMYNEAKNLFDLLQNLLEWSMYQSKSFSFAPSRIKFSSVAEKALEYIKTARADKEQHIVKDFNPDIMVMADVQMLSSVMRNLLFNAVKFTPVGGTITLSVKQISPRLVEISVTDTGMGIPDKILSNLFMVGENVSRAGTKGESSTGLGLILCKDFVAAHGSQIRVQSQVGLGTTFSFTLQS